MDCSSRFVPVRILPFLNHSSKFRSIKDRSRGFALLITIVLVSFLVLLLVGLASLTRVETQVAANSQNVSRARQNALMALGLAQGRLQEAAGPDQRVTATASLLSTRNTVHESKLRWTGVWPTQTPGDKPIWLVSDSAPDLASAAPELAEGEAYRANTLSNLTQQVRLVGATSTDLAAPGNGVVLTTQPIRAKQNAGLDESNAEVIGQYAYWVGDEGVKARIDLVNPFAERSATDGGTPALASYTPDLETKRRQSWLALRTGGELLARGLVAPDVPAPDDYLGDDAYPALGKTPASANFRRDLPKVSSSQQLALLERPGLDRTFLRRRFHDITVNSRGVLADVARGGLKLDLTAALLGPTAPSGMGNDDPLFNLPDSGWSGETPSRLPSWGALRSYVRWGDPVTGLSGPVPEVLPRPTTDQAMGIYPVMTRTQIWVHSAVEIDKTTGQTGVHALYFPAVVLWNPYDVTLAATRYSATIGATSKVMTGVTGSSPPWLNLKAVEGSGTPIPGSPSDTGDSTINPTIGWIFMIDSPALEPGQAVIFTLPANQHYPTTAPASRVLVPGWRPFFWHEKVQTLPAGAPAVERVNLIMPRVTNTLCELHLGDAFSTGTSARPTGPLLQIIRRGELGGGQSLSIDSKSLATSIAPPYLFLNSPSAGWFSQFQFAANATNQRGNLWLAHYNPVAPEVTRTALELKNAGNGIYNGNPSLLLTGSSTIGSIYFPINTPDGFLAYTGYRHDNGSTRTVLFHLPRRETGVLSLGTLQHASVHPATGTYDEKVAGYTASAMPAYAIGNSRADPRVAPTELDGFPNNWSAAWSTSVQKRKFHFDLSYVLNQALWDRYFFSTVPGTGPVGFPLPQARLAPYTPAGAASTVPDETSLRDPLQAAARLLVTGAFNIHSTSLEAWRAVLASLRDTPVLRADGGTAATPNQQRTAYPRSPYPQSDPITHGTASQVAEQAAYSGFRNLTDRQLDALARQIVQQVQARGPFLGLAQFVNRTPGSPAPAHQLAGALQAAIDATDINTPLAAPINTKGLTKDPEFFYTDSAEGNGTAALPGSLTQADLLQALGPVLTARSDTFVIRAYGEAVNPATQATEARAWCEAVLQRFPDYIKSENDQASAWPATHPDNQRFGRAFRIVSFRWLTPEDL